MSIATLALILAQGRGLERTREMSIPEKQCLDWWKNRDVKEVPQHDQEDIYQGSRM